MHTEVTDMRKIVRYWVTGNSLSNLQKYQQANEKFPKFQLQRACRIILTVSSYFITTRNIDYITVNSRAPIHGSFVFCKCKNSYLAN